MKKISRLLFFLLSISCLKASYIELESIEAIYSKSSKSLLFLARISPDELKNSLEKLCSAERTATNMKKGEGPFDIWGEFLSMVDLSFHFSHASSSFFLLKYFGQIVGCGFYFSQDETNTECTLYMTRYKNPFLLKDMIGQILKPVCTKKVIFTFLPEFKKINREKRKMIFNFSKPNRLLQMTLSSLGFKETQCSTVVFHEKRLKKDLL